MVHVRQWRVQHLVFRVVVRSSSRRERSALRIDLACMILEDRTLFLAVAPHDRGALRPTAQGTARHRHDMARHASHAVNPPYPPQLIRLNTVRVCYAVAELDSLFYLYGSCLSDLSVPVLSFAQNRNQSTRGRSDRTLRPRPHRPGLHCVPGVILDAHAQAQRRHLSR